MATFSGMPSPVTTRPESMEDYNFYLEGFADDITGDVESPSGHLYRIESRITCTNSQGFSETYIYANEDDAKKVFEWAREQYHSWLDETQEV